MAGFDDLITITPDDMTLGYDASGTPISVPTNPNASSLPPDRRADPVNATEFETMKKRLEDAERERERLARETAAEKTAREEAEARAAKADKDAGQNTEYALRAHWKNINLELRDAEKDAEQLASWITATKAFQTQARADLTRAIEAGDAGAQADAHERLGTAAAHLVQLEEGKRGADRTVIERKAGVDDTARRLSTLKPPAEREPEKKEEKKAPRLPQTADEFISVAPEKTRDWLREHRDYATPGTKEYQRVQAFANMWLADKGGDGTSLNTDEFRAALDDKFFPKAKEPEMADEVKVEATAPAPQQQQRTAPPAAPVSRAGTPQAGNSRPGSIKLTQEQFNAAPELAGQADWDVFDPDLKQKFGAWSPTAARFQYERWLQKAKAEKGHRFS